MRTQIKTFVATHSTAHGASTEATDQAQAWVDERAGATVKVVTTTLTDVIAAQNLHSYSFAVTVVLETSDGTQYS
jgi:hypothetical protein